MFLPSYFLLVLSIAVLANGECPTGWIFFGDYCYHYHDVTYATSGMNWNDSRLACQRYGADLLTIKNQAEFQFISGNLTAAQKRQHYWIGLTDVAKEGTFVWIDGTSVAATGSHWRTANGEPNNWGGNEDCAEMHFDGKWNDNGCFREFAFICKKNKSTPIPPAPTLPPRPSSTAANCKLTEIGADYRGNMNTTKSGYTCQRWDTQKPHKHESNTPETKPHSGLDHNYCRNPDQEPMGPWCYTTTPGKRWEYCNIKLCKSGPITCEAGWQGFSNSCYKFSREFKTWAEGRSDCQARGGDLVVVEGREEHNYLTNQVKRDRQGFWIGLTDKYAEGNFYWVDETSLNSSRAFWGRNEPSNAFGGEDCVEMYTWWNRGLWNDNKCTTKRYFICEKKSGKSMCPESWITYNGTCYQINAHPEQKKTWLQADAACRSFEGANLVSIHGTAIQKKLTAEFQKVFTRSGYFWLGLNDDSKEGTFAYSDGSKYDYANWGLNEQKKNTESLNCVRSELRTWKGDWSLASCNSTSERNYYVCARKREYDRCHSPLGMEDFDIPNDQITASSQKSQTTPAFSGRRNAVKGFGLDGAWCAATNDRNQWLRIDLGEYYTVGFIGLQGHPGTTAFVKQFYLKYSPDGLRWSVYGYNPPSQSYKSLPGNTATDRSRGAVAELSPPVKARFVEIHPTVYEKAICMRVEVYGCPAVSDFNKCGTGWLNNTALNTCYKVGMKSLPWTAARANCLLEDGDLLSITSHTEYQFIQRTLYPLRLKTYSFWIGLNCRDAKYKYRWSDGAPLSTVQWYTSNPTISRYREYLCVALRTYHSAWYNSNCATARPYVCKKKLRSSSDPPEKYTGNWISKTDQYWPLNDVSDGVIAGTRSGNAYGTFTSGYTPAGRQYLSFNGQNSYVKIPGLAQTCISDPSRCTNGFTLSMMLNLDASLSRTNGKVYILDILGQGFTDSLGSYVYVDNGQVGVFMRSTYHSWHSIITPILGKWVHVVIVWNQQNGLTVYQNGQNLVTDNSGTRLSANAHVERISGLYIGKAASSQKFTKFQMMSLGVWERALSSDEVNDVYFAEMGSCKIGWIPFGQYCYQFNTNRSSYSSAKQDCELKAGNLATVFTSLQQAFLSIGISPAGVNQDSFIGLNSMRRRRFFEFTDGSPMLFSYWLSNKPSGYTWRRAESVVMNTNYYGRWSDLSYYYSRGYVCQRKKAILTSAPASSTGNINKTVSQYQSMNYGCPLGTKLNILSATFGKAPSCPYRDVLAKVLSMCARKTMNCQVYASTTNFNRSCSGTRKELKTTYKCVRDDSFTSSTGCDANWSAMPASSYCYKFNQQKKNWTDADKYCKSKGAQLVSIQSRLEEFYITTMLINSYELTNVWLGLNDLTLRGSYKWSDKSFVAYTNWYNGQPDDGSRRGSCVKASLNQGYRDFVSWTDDDCATKNAFVCKKLKASATTSTPVMTRVSNSSCLSGWFRYKSNCYQISKTTATWNDAKSICLRQKSTLATVHSLDENEALFNFLVNASLDSAWIGMNDKGIFRGQQWVDGSAVNFVRWDSKQPDSNLGQQACTVMASNGYWRDNDCAMVRNYICKASIGKATVVPTTKKLTTPVTPTANLKYCPRRWVWSPVTRNCYYFSNRTESLSWFMARSFCRSNGGDLVSIEGSVEQSYLEPFGLTFPNKEAWIGLSDLSNEGGWEWSDGKPAKYFNWLTNQPDDWHGMEDCATIKSSGMWNDDYCGNKNSFICKRQNNLSPAPNTVAPTAGAPRGYCQPGWVHYRSKCFKLNDKEALTWYSARNVCRNEIVDGRRGDLASIHSAAENAFLFSQMKGMSMRTLYIGFNDIQVEGKFRWSDQSEVSFTKWYSRQPDNYWGREDCTEMYPFGVHKGKWNDIQCTTKLGYVCEKDASSKPYPTNPTTAPKNDSCPNGYLKYGNNCYSFKKQPLTWDEAVKFCRNDNTNSDLVSIHDLYDAAYVFSHMAEFTNRFWTGLHRPKNETKFRWSDNHPLDYTQWSAYPGRRMMHLRSCVHAYYSKSSPGYWVDGNCTAKLPFVCKIGRADKEVVPEHPGNCDAGWLKFDKYCYLVSNSYYGTKVWSDARQRCRDKGAELASIHSIEEQKFLYKAVSKGKKSVWIGLNDRRMEKHMVWSDGTPYDFDNWNTREPNDNAGSENCIEMIFMTGRWNDIRCSSYMGYICKKELGCDSAFGMANDKKNITDKQISASSVYGTNFAQNARLNSRSGWCAQTQDQKQFIQIDFGEKKRLTRISTQGWSRNYVLSYQLKYSDHGDTWSTYRIDGRDAILPGNRASYTTEGVTLDPPVSARFVRINPLTWRYRICLRLEFYGCGYVCNQPLGMESRTIKNAEVKASTEEDTQKAYAARFRNPHGQGWCAKAQNAEQWLQIHLSNSPMTVSKVATQGVTVGDKKYVVRAYKLMYSDDAITWTAYKSYKGEIRILSGNVYPDSGVSHTLTMPFSAKYIRFIPLSWSGKICLRVEVFGCPYECNRALGVETGIIPDKAMTASTATEKHEASLARLNKGKFNVGSWCAAKNDQQQYLEFDLGAESRITAVATQGFEGDISKYVIEYRLQYSQNGKFWSTYEVKGVIQTFSGNNDARSVNVKPLASPIRARYIRLNPQHWMQGICMRAELYGCPLQPIIYPTDAPTPKKKVFSGSVRFTDSEYKEEYKNKSSKAYLKMANKIETAITKLYLDNYAFKEGFESVQVTDLKPGSVVAVFVVIYLTNDNNATWPLKNAVSKGKLGDLTVDTKSLKIKDVNEPSSRGKATQIVKKEGLSTGGKVALIVIFLLMIVAIVVVGLIYYFKKRGKAQFDHKSFDNPIHYNNDNYSASGGRVENLPGQD